MMNADLIVKYFPHLNAEQIERFAKLGGLYADWNEKINVISRKDMDSFYERHVLHSLAIIKVIQFKPGTRVLDVGTGGGFPGIPLAILFPETEFVLIDSIGKKIKVVTEVSEAIGLRNVTAIHGRAEKVSGQFDFVVSRAVTRMDPFYNWIKAKFKSRSINDLQNGILYLKGGDLSEELKNFPRAEQFAIRDYFQIDFFETKKVVYLPVKTNKKGR